MWEDKGPSFTKLTKPQYVSSGEKEPENPDFYINIDSDPSAWIKRKNDQIVQDMLTYDHISEKVAEFSSKWTEQYIKLLSPHNNAQDSI